jgi:hypothetical protein
MDVISAAEVVSLEDRVIQIAFDLYGSEPEYLIISMPDTEGGTKKDFFGHAHYVELKDQMFGRYGGLTELSVPQDDRVELRLAFEVPGVGTALAINRRKPMTPEILCHLRRLQGS